MLSSSDYFRYESIALIVITLVKLCSLLALTRRFGPLMYLLWRVAKSCLIFGCVVVVELFAFTVLCIMIETRNDNTIEHIITMLIEGNILFGNYEFENVGKL